MTQKLVAAKDLTIAVTRRALGSATLFILKNNKSQDSKEIVSGILTRRKVNDQKISNAWKKVRGEL